MNNDVDTSGIALIAIICITILGSIYILMGHNSWGFTALVGSISGIGGYKLPQLQFKK